jgi:hypothetical protein
MWRELLDKKLGEIAKTWVMRDFHSPNIIWLGGREGIKRISIIDFQDTVLGQRLRPGIAAGTPDRRARAARLVLFSPHQGDARRTTISTPQGLPSSAVMSAQRNCSCSAPLPGSTGATASRNICATSPDLDLPQPLAGAPALPPCTTGMWPTSRRRVPDLPPVRPLALIW